jgi:uncharacterized membrane protein YphA (DoxX/SURF4 family)
LSSYWKYPVYVLVAVFILRLAVGFHFFREGWTKVEDGFTSAGFFGAAVGPFAPMFHAMTPDREGRERLVYTKTVHPATEERGERIEISSPTKDSWKTFHERAVAEYGIGDAKWLEVEKERKAALEAQLKQARDAKNVAREQELVYEIGRSQDAIRNLADQRRRADRILARYRDQFDYLILVNEEDLQTYYRDLDRVAAYRQDPSWTGTDSLRGQVDKVATDAKKKATPWLKSVDRMWDDYEAEMNSLASPAQLEAAGGPLALQRPWLSRPNTTWIDSIIPYFDLAIGALLILGLFSRAAALFAAGFLAMVVVSQWPWAPGAAPVYYQFVEFAAALCLIAFPSGQFLGLDGVLRSMYLRLTSRRERADAPTPATA